ncbi:MAG: hypothetical protein IIY09_03465 [Clostridia bacterium]|nr:hypothetical protein [Clostridia bacterium]MBQ5802250.1 hypothetical protein [Clostridia bacterium]
MDIFSSKPAVAAGDTCYHRVYGYGTVLNVYKDDNNRQIVQARFSSGFQYINYVHFMDNATVFAKGENHPLCPRCGKNPVLTEGEACFDCQKKQQEEQAPKKKAVSGYFDDEEDDEPLLDRVEVDMGYLEDMEEDEGGTGRKREDDEDFLKYGYSYGQHSR